MILTGRGVAGEEAARMGLVNRLCEPGETLEVARRLAQLIAHHPQTCMRSDRRSVYEQWDIALDEALRRETELGIQVVASGETLTSVGRWSSGNWSFEEFANA
jgi:enoyl-CoA hydratase